MRYTVFHDGQPIGETDLGFVRTQERVRFGWFYPNALGETLMPVVSALVPALRALVQLERGERAQRDAESLAQLRASTEYADYYEALHRFDALDLTLRREDGSVVPTEQVSLQDTVAQQELARPEYDDAPGRCDDDIDAMLPGLDLADEAELEAAIEADRAILHEWERERAMRDWTPSDEEEAEMGRFQIFVLLLDDAAIP